MEFVGAGQIGFFLFGGGGVAVVEVGGQGWRGGDLKGGLVVHWCLERCVWDGGVGAIAGVGDGVSLLVFWRWSRRRG